MLVLSGWWTHYPGCCNIFLALRYLLSVAVSSAICCSTISQLRGNAMEMSHQTSDQGSSRSSRRNQGSVRRNRGSIRRNRGPFRRTAGVRPEEPGVLPEDGRAECLLEVRPGPCQQREDPLSLSHTHSCSCTAVLGALALRRGVTVAEVPWCFPGGTSRSLQTWWYGRRGGGRTGGGRNDVR